MRNHPAVNASAPIGREASSRYGTVDSLRGLASVAVALFHIQLAAFYQVHGVLLDALRAVFYYGALGVPVFFAISGFVIAAAFSKEKVTFGYFGRFLLKRAIRLDPPYWASMALTICFVYAASNLMLSSVQPPTSRNILLHMFYLQNLAGVENIQEIYWTLCMEIQFYIIFGLILVADHKLAGTKSWLLGLVTACAVLFSLGWVVPPLPGLFITHWIEFAIGIAAFVCGRSGRGVVFPVMGISMLLLSLFQWQSDLSWLVTVISCLTAGFMYAGLRLGKLNSWLTNRVLLYLGSRSYSIYLTHPIIGPYAAKVFMRLIAPRLGADVQQQGWAIAALIIGLAASLIAAEGFYRLVEGPALTLSRRMGSRRTIGAAKAREELQLTPP